MKQREKKGDYAVIARLRLTDKDDNQGQAQREAEAQVKEPICRQHLDGDTINHITRCAVGQA